MSLKKRRKVAISVRRCQVAVIVLILVLVGFAPTAMPNAAQAETEGEWQSLSRGLACAGIMKIKQVLPGGLVQVTDFGDEDEFLRKGEKRFVVLNANVEAQMGFRSICWEQGWGLFRLAAEQMALACLPKACQKLTMVWVDTNGVRPEVIIDRWQEGRITRADAIQGFVNALGASYAGNCTQAKSPQDLGKMCSALVSERSNVAAFMLGRTFSEFTLWVFAEKIGDAWHVTWLYPMRLDESTDNIPWPDSQQ